MAFGNLMRGITDKVEGGMQAQQAGTTSAPPEPPGPYKGTSFDPQSWQRQPVQPHTPFGPQGPSPFPGGPGHTPHTPFSPQGPQPFLGGGMHSGLGGGYGGYGGFQGPNAFPGMGMMGGAISPWMSMMGGRY